MKVDAQKEKLINQICSQIDCGETRAISQLKQQILRSSISNQKPEHRFQNVEEKPKEKVN